MDTTLAKRFPPAPPSPPELYMSTALTGEIAGLLGTPHYSYHFAAERFRALLARRVGPPRHLALPEGQAAISAGTGLHLIFRSTEQIRLLKQAVNVACFPWEFPVMKTDTLPGEHPFADQRRMLALCDEVWTPSAFAVRVLGEHGIGHAHRIPAPVDAAPRARTNAALDALGALPCVRLDTNFLWPPGHAEARALAAITPLGDAIRRHAHGHAGARPRIYLSVLNPEDYRKNIDAMLRGFHHFRSTHPDAVLIVKALTATSRFSLPQVASDVIPYKLAGGTVLRDDGILIINAYLSDAEMSLLYSLADCYLCTSIAEGQNLPLLEAMAHGTLAVTTANTAMADYIDAGCAFVIADHEVVNDDVHLAGTVARRGFAVRRAGSRDVYRALCAAHAAPEADRAARAAAGIDRVTARFGQDAVWALVAARLARHGWAA